MYMNCNENSAYGWYQRDFIDYNFELFGKKVTIHKTFGTDRDSFNCYFDEHTVVINGVTIDHDALMSDEEQLEWQDTVNNHEVEVNLYEVEAMLKAIVARHLGPTMKVAFQDKKINKAVL